MMASLGTIFPARFIVLICDHGKDEPMSDAEMFMEQARILRSLADTFDVPSMKEDLLRLAKRCEDFARAKSKRDAEDEADPRSRPKASVAQGQ